MPLVEDRLALRISVLSETRDGYQDLIDFACDRPGLAGSIPAFRPGLESGHCKVGAYGGKDVGVRIATDGGRRSLDLEALVRLAAAVDVNLDSDDAPAAAWRRPWA